MNPSCTHDEAGFSLLEVIITLAVAGLIAGATSGLMSFWSRVDAKTAETTKRLDEVLSAERLLRNFVTLAVPQPSPTTLGSDASAAEGDSQSLRLMTFGPASLRLDRPTPLSLRIREAAGRRNLSLDWTDPQSGEARSELVLASAKQLSFRYFHRDRDRRAAWSDSWYGGSLLPAAIALTIEDEVLGPPLEIIVRTVGKMPAACVLLPADPSCQGGGS